MGSLELLFLKTFIMGKEKIIVSPFTSSFVIISDKYDDAAPEWGWGPPSDIKTTKVMNTILNIENTDLVVLNGDLITGENTHYHNSTKYFDIIVGPMVQRGIPWASAYGNHDHQYNLSTEKLLAREQLYPKLSLTRDMVRDADAGTSNYVLPVFGSSSQAVPEVLLWFFDSRGGRNYQKTGDAGYMSGTVHDAVSLPFSPKNSTDEVEGNPMVSKDQ
jgi:Calcineurin-like phosphoesterase